ncbi:hypothetical protein PFICI_07043 [Pestalotiopsis fici W106-1]|uniref:Uncharacterized protein n=1 Tax=Pestalotiopsis fici (strain W106-1 / CGMCC3.15140) TaxID=1229662 RepID=W3XA39_PESFW|nr:uncharacterized protein PFICI_07043 [Pestalotiopsis fici W106-1]ETS82041.1 hypothetical protein PFICI_07043 [Pestalotiopsis fici W106-1]
MLSRSSSNASTRSVRAGGKSKSTTAYICKHESMNSRLNSVVSGIPLDMKTKKCPDCQTATPVGAIRLLAVLCKEEVMKDVDAATRRKLAESLFERLADRRRSVLKDDWDEISMLWATLCYLYVPIAELKHVCGTLRSRYGAGMDKLILQTLARAACVQENVWDIFEPKDTPMFSTANHIVADLRKKNGQVERFSQVEDIFIVAKELGGLCDTTVAVYNKVSLRLDRWDNSRK